LIISRHWWDILFFIFISLFILHSCGLDWQVGDIIWRNMAGIGMGWKRLVRLFYSVGINKDWVFRVWSWWVSEGWIENIVGHTSCVNGTCRGWHNPNYVARGVLEEQTAHVGKVDIVPMDANEGRLSVRVGRNSGAQRGDDAELVGGGERHGGGNCLAVGRDVAAIALVGDPLVDWVSVIINGDRRGVWQGGSIANSGMVNMVIRKGVFDEVAEDGHVNEHGSGCCFVGKGVN
jgi:hypothetical protein